jgi:hypothetical protein
MRRRTTASALAALVLCAGLSVAQPQAPPKAVDPTDALIQKALANDPDVQVARAKLALAEAEVAKARHAAVTRVITLRDTVEQQRQAVARAVESFVLKERMAKANQLSREELLVAQDRLAAARAALERAETELRLLTGDGPKAAAGRAAADDIAEEVAWLLASSHPKAVERALASLNQKGDLKALGGPVVARLGEALEKKVVLGPKGEKVRFDDALEAFRSKAGFNIPVRPMPSPLPEIVSDGVELPVIAWLQMFQDLGGRQGEGFAFYVREYGLLVANRQTAPPDAVSLTAFWRAHCDEVAAPAPKQPDPKQPAGKRHELAHDKLPKSFKAKVGDDIVVPLPVKAGDVEEAKGRPGDPALTVQIETVNGVAVVVIRAARPVRTRCDWQVTDLAGRAFKGPLDVEFE